MVLITFGSHAEVRRVARITNDSYAELRRAVLTMVVMPRCTKRYRNHGQSNVELCQSGIEMVV